MSEYIALELVFYPMIFPLKGASRWSGGRGEFD